MAGFDLKELKRRRDERTKEAQGQLVERVVAWGTHWDAGGEKLPGEVVKVPEADARQLEAQGTLVTSDAWAAMQELQAAQQKLQEVRQAEGADPVSQPVAPSEAESGEVAPRLDAEEMPPELAGYQKGRRRERSGG